MSSQLQSRRIISTRSPLAGVRRRIYLDRGKRTQDSKPNIGSKELGVQPSSSSPRNESVRWRTGRPSLHHRISPGEGNGSQPARLPLEKSPENSCVVVSLAEAALLPRNPFYCATRRRSRRS